MKFILPALIAVAAGMPRSAFALPTMIRLGYTNCAACHISPQGGGLLNPYGRGIDEAQSLRASEYKPSDNSFVKALSWGGRITQDIRGVTQEQFSTTTNKPWTNFMRSRWMYRNATEFGKGFRFSAVVMGESATAHRPNLAYEHSDRVGTVYVPTALISYRASNSLEFAAGRDQLPNGVNLPDLALFIRSRDRFGYYDAPTQVKMFWWGKRHQITPFVFGPGGNERAGEHEGGGGMLAEYDVLGHQRTVVGMNVLRGTARNFDRTLVGPYVRLGFGKWGILAEHDITKRSLVRPTVTSFNQSASYAQVFWAIREWLVASGIGERLSVERPFREQLIAGRFEVAARLSSQVTLGISTRLQRNQMNGAMSPSVALQLAVKTVN